MVRITCRQQQHQAGPIHGHTLLFHCIWEGLILLYHVLYIILPRYHPFINGTTVLQPIPDICHLDHLHVGGEKICHVEKFQISIHEISPHEEEFQFYHTTDVEKCEILPNLEKFHISPQDRCKEI